MTIDEKNEVLSGAPGLKARWRPYLIPLGVLIVSMLGTALFSPRLLRLSSLMGFLSDASPLLALVIGATFPILLGSIDVSLAGFASLASVLVVQLNPHCGSWSSVVVVILAALVGAFQGFILGWAQIPSLVGTLGTLSILGGVSMLLTNGTPELLPDSDTLVAWIGRTSFGIPNAALVLLLALVVLELLLRYTRLGRDIYAVGSAEQAAAISGVKTARLRVIVFAISAACGALAGILLLSVSTFSSPTPGANFLLVSIVGVLVGGTAVSGGVGGVMFSVIGGLTAAWFSIATVVIGIRAEAQNAVFGLMVLMAVAFTTDRRKIGIIK